MSLFTNSAVVLVGVLVLKILENIFGTTKTLFVQRNRAVAAGIALGLAALVSYIATKAIVLSDGYLIMIIASIGAGVGCCLAVRISMKLSHRPTYTEWLCKDVDAMRAFHEFLKDHKVIQVVYDTYSADLQTKELTIRTTTYSCEELQLVSEYVIKSEMKVKKLLY